MKMPTNVRRLCDHPGCDAGITYPEDHPAFIEESGWLIEWKADARISTLKEDFCPDHGRCSWCKERKPRRLLTPGTGECEGQLICGECIIRREG